MYNITKEEYFFSLILTNLAMIYSIIPLILLRQAQLPLYTFTSFSLFLEFLDKDLPGFYIPFILFKSVSKVKYIAVLSHPHSPQLFTATVFFNSELHTWHLLENQFFSLSLAKKLPGSSIKTCNSTKHFEMLHSKETGFIYPVNNIWYVMAPNLQ